MPIDPRVEEPLRELLGHAIRDELDDVAEKMLEAGEQVYEAIRALCVQVSAYITIDVSNRWPAEADLHEVAKIGARSVTKLPVTEDEMYEFLARSVFGFERIVDVFPDAKRASIVPLFTTANILLSFSHEGKHWSDYLDVIESGIEASEETSLFVLPSLMYRHRVFSVHAGKNIRPSTTS